MIDCQAILEAGPSPYLILDPGLLIVAVTDSYLDATMTKREEIIGKGLFEVFPDNPEDVGADGVSNLAASLERVLTLGASDKMAIQKYDIRKPNGEWEERYWSPLNTPVFKNGDIGWIIHYVEDVTELVTLQHEVKGRRGWRRWRRRRQLEEAVEVVKARYS